MRYPVLLLDVGGTLVGPRDSFGAVYGRALAELGHSPDHDRIERSIVATWQQMDEANPSGEDRYSRFPGGEAEYWLQFARGVLDRAFDGRLPEDTATRVLPRIREAFLHPSAWTVFADVRPALDRLADEGVRMAVVSNWDSNLPRVLEMLELTEYFETVVVSHLEGVEKPNPQLFHRAVERMGAEPGEALHVGDVPELDLAGAEAAGIDALLVDRHGRFDLARSIPDFSSLPRIVRQGTG
jgi:putative hydrolase of the HAD superfamily